MVAAVGGLVESDPIDKRPGVRVRLLGSMTLSRHGQVLPLPTSRKARALLAFLAVSPAPVSRSRLCELLWDVPNDPRGELRWCLSKLRRVLDQPGRRRVRTGSDTIRLDLADCFVDALEVARAARQGFENLETERLRALSGLFTGEFLEGMELNRSPDFCAWVLAERRRFHSRHLAVLAQLASSTAGDEVFRYLESWMQLAPFDSRVHELLLTALARRGRMRDAEEHLAATARQFEAEGLDPRPIRNFWRAAWAREHLAARVGDAPVAAPLRPDNGASAAEAAHRVSLAVLPFDEWPRPEGTAQRAGELVQDVIARLTGLRSFRILAGPAAPGARPHPRGGEDTAAALDADYTVGGVLRRQAKRLDVAVQLVETRLGRIAWADVFHHTLDDALQSLEEIGYRIVAPVASEIERLECNRAILKPPGSVDAWEAHHRGLWHLYRFDQAENERARHCFELALRLDPTFARVYAGLSLAHFQDAIQGWSEAGAVERAIEAAGRALVVDARDPAAHWAMGHALSLRGERGALTELETAIELSPEFARNRFALAFVHERPRASAPAGFAGLPGHLPMEAPAAGDHAVIGTTLPLVGELLADACDLHWDEPVLDIAAGNDSVALAAARRGCKVTSAPLPPVLRPGTGGRRPAAGSSRPGSSDTLPFPDASFEAVVSTFGVMFSCRPAKTASELARVCRPGGRIGIASWTPEGFIGRMLRVLWRYLRALSGVQSPWLWGVEASLWSLFGADAASISATRRTLNFRFRSVTHFLDVFWSWCAPLQRAFGAVLTEQPQALDRRLVELLGERHRSDPGPLVIPGEYLEAVIVRA